MFYVKALYTCTSVFYALCGIIFSFFPASFFNFFKVTYPNHWSYVHFIGLMCFIFALMAYQIARKPVQKRDLIVYIILVQIFYPIGIFIDTQLFGMPNVWVWGAYGSLIFAAVYAWTYVFLKKR